MTRADGHGGDGNTSSDIYGIRASLQKVGLLEPVCSLAFRLSAWKHGLEFEQNGQLLSLLAPLAAAAAGISSMFAPFTNRARLVCMLESC